ncbi:uncharacterized protein LOC18043651 [Citrus clementina]|uniref:uncharacterized protein LOC18043651 n=1 Tax=Citrus clementina TaxID=85681 RepID=UPI000CECF20E|nr:uncharacterized protein LOC18043651 [Citrus x clementina]
MKKYPNMKHSLKYCEFYQDFSHSTTECFTLREEIESLILSGYFKEFVAAMREARKSTEQDKGKRVADGSLEREVASTLVDTSSSVDIIFKSALDQVLIESPKITPYATPLIGFAGDMVIPKGIITLPVALGKAIHSSVGQHPSSLRATSPSDNALLAGHLKCNYARYTPSTSTVTYNLKSKPQQNLKWRRVVFKISGSALVGNCHNIDPKVVMQIAREVASACRLGMEVAIVLGGRNFFCGDSWLSDTGFDRPTAYQIGMMATVMNSILLQSALEKLEIKTRVQSAFALPEVDEPYSRQRAIPS